MKISDINVIKKNGSLQKFDMSKVMKAVNKSSKRVMANLSNPEIMNICEYVEDRVLEECTNNKTNSISVQAMHSIVEMSLDKVNPDVAKSYREYRDIIKNKFSKMMEKVYQRSKEIMFRGDQENANADSALVSTKRALCYNVLNKEMYQKFFLTTEENQACDDGYIYVHDMSARRDTMNCCLFDVKSVLENGFNMGNMWYNEPKSLDTAFDVIGDITLGAAGQQYGGFTLPQIDETLAKYAELSYHKYVEEFDNIANTIYDADISGESRVYNNIYNSRYMDEKSHEYAIKKLERDIEQGYQGWEYKFNTVASCRGDYPFITITIGHGIDELSKLIAKIILRTHAKGQGKEGKKQPTVFPKIVFLYDKNIHGEGKECRDVYEEAVNCSSKTMYPDWLSLTGDGYVPSMFKKYGKIISPMGCRAFLSPYYERGGFNPADEEDIPVFIGRFNIGAISLHLPMILAKSREENRDFYEVLDYYLELIRQIHLRTREYLGNMKASCNPLAYCEGGFYGGHLNLHDKIEPLMKYCTASFGITALNELNMLYNGKSIYEDGEFPLEVMTYINNKKNEYTKEDGLLYAIYGTPAENLCGLQVKQFRNKYGIIEGVSDKDYVSNSFHCHVTEDITTIQKQNSEERFWNLFNGGKIQYCRYPINYNRKAIETLINRAMDKGFYEGVNLALSYCNDCGYQSTEMDIEDCCPKCGSKSINRIDRMNGYLGFTRSAGDELGSRFSDHKRKEISERISM